MARKWQERRTKMKTFEEEAWSTNHTIFITAANKYTKKGIALHVLRFQRMPLSVKKLWTAEATFRLWSPSLHTHVHKKTKRENQVRWPYTHQISVKCCCSVYQK